MPPQEGKGISGSVGSQKATDQQREEFMSMFDNLIGEAREFWGESYRDVLTSAITTDAPHQYLRQKLEQLSPSAA